jgi:hypothetical protein
LISGEEKNRRLRQGIKTGFRHLLFHLSLQTDRRRYQAAEIGDESTTNMNLPVFLMADPREHPVQGGSIKGETNLNRSILQTGAEGEPIITAARSADGWGLRAIVPFYAFDKNQPAGILLLGSRIDDDFAKKIAKKPAARS